MSGKLDKPLDEIVSAQRKNVRARRASQRRTTGRPAVTAPIGGIKKSAKTARGAATKPMPAKGGAPTGESKVIVSNLVCLPRFSLPL